MDVDDEGHIPWGPNSIGVYRTTNAGSSWESIGLFGEEMRKVLLARYQGDVHLFVTTDEGLYECEDALASSISWETLLTGNFYDIEFNPQNNGVLYASGSGATTVYSIDWINDSYTELPNIGSIPQWPYRRISIENSSLAPDYLFIVAAYYFSHPSKLYRYKLSTNEIFYIDDLPDQDYINGGVSVERSMAWKICPLTNAGNTPLAMVHGATAPIRYTTDLFNTNPGASWTNITAGYTNCEIHVDMIHMTLNPSGTEFWVASDGGVYMSTIANLGNDWQPRSHGLGVATVQKLAINNDIQDVYANGTYDCGSNLNKKENSIWNTYWLPKGGDSYNCLFNWNNPSSLWFTSSNRLYNYNLNDPLNRNSIVLKNCCLGWYSIFTQHSLLPNIFYAVSGRTPYEPNPPFTLDHLIRSDDSGDNWENYSNYPLTPHNKTWCIATSKNNPNYLLIGAYNTTIRLHTRRVLRGSRPLLSLGRVVLP